MREIEDVLGRLIAADSSNPPGNETAVAGVIESVASALGLPRPVVHAATPRRPNLLIEIGRGEPILLVAAHMDTVPAGDLRSWRSDPGALLREGDAYAGLGVADMKGAIAAMLVAAASSRRGSGRLLLAFTADEEGPGDCGMPWLIRERGLRPDAAIMLEPASVSDASWDGLYVASRGSCVLDLTAAGTPGHTAVPEDPAQRSGRRLVDALTALYERDLFPRHRHPLDGSPVLVNAPSTLSGGVTPWQHPGTMRAQVEIRTVPGMTRDGVHAAVSAALESRRLHDSVEVSITSWGEPSTTTTDARLLSAAQVAARAALGRDLQPAVFPAITDGIHTAAAGIATLHAFGPGTLRAVHQPNEWVRIDDIGRCVVLLQALLATYFDEHRPGIAPVPAGNP